MPADLPLTDALAFLTMLRVANVRPPEALWQLRELRERAPEVAFELIWDHEDLGDVTTYELLLSCDGLGTVSLSLTADGSLPFALRGMQRWRDAQVVRVDGRAMWWHEALTFLDPLWGEIRVLDRLVDAMIVRRECELHPFQASADALQGKLDELRRRHGLLTPEATEQWLAERGQTLAAIESAIEEELAYEAVRARHVGGAAEAAFAANPSPWDEVQLVALPAANEAVAARIAAELRAGGDLFATAERTLAARTGHRGSRSVLFETLRRHEIAADAPVCEGTIAPARLRGAGPYVIHVRRVARAVWDDATRVAVEQELFAAWLRERRAAAHVEWNWGAG